MIPISALITPYHPMEQSSPAALGNSLGGLGQFYEDRQQNKVAEDLAKLKADRSYELEKSATEGKNDYYKSQAETAREKIGADRETKDEASVSKLLDQLPAAHRSGDSAKVSALYDRLRSMGNTVTESDTALPEDKPAPSKDAVQAADQQTAKPKAAPKKQSILPPEFAGYDSLAGASRGGPSLAQSSYASVDENGEPAPPPPPGTAVKRPVPPEIAALVPEGASSASPSAGPAPGKRGGKFTVTDKEGNVLHEYDAPLEQKRTRDQIQQMAEPLVGRARNPEEEKVYAAAAESTAKLVGVLPPNELVKYFQDSVKTQLGEFKKSRMGDQGGGAAGPSKAQLAMESKGDDVTFKVAAALKSENKLPDLEAAKQHAEEALTHLSNASDGGMSQLAGIKSYLLSVSGKVVTDNEMNQFLGATGAPNAWEAKLDHYISGGQMPPEFLRQLGTLLSTVRNNATKQIQGIGQAAYDARIRFDGDAGQADIARGMITKQFESAVPEASSSRAPRKAAPVGGPAPQAAPPAGDPKAAALARARKLLGQ